ncbi:aminoglycoside phosphotransferase family protein [Jiangella alba]|uniref:Phosphotransferase enzyme family protein n=1 Tax=Jiangella alba TaxID=561176 RepID=A0A1H5GV86_9ACTN|nr:aminoglycoside phosphotransferase family protein [Jiangella alba]SEE19414.1 Phosphotransferase enzyme family protein [Jiangella alba]
MIIDDPLLAALAGTGLAAPDDVRAVRHLPGRALCSQVGLADGRLLFVKRARPGRPAVTGEAGVVRAVNALPGTAAIAPELLAVDVAGSAAVYRGYQDWRTLTGWPDVGPDVVGAIGAALARLHAVRPGTHPIDGIAPTGPFGRPTLDWAAVTPAALAAFPSGFREVWARAAATHTIVDRLAARWRPSALIHGDVKHDNVVADGGRVVLLDWETAGWGDPLWDLGSLVGNLVQLWLHTLRLTPGGTLESWLSGAPVPLDELRSRVRAALSGYGPLTPADRGLVAAHAGVFLLQRALAAGLLAERLDAPGVLTAHLAAQLLTDPDRTAPMLL